MKSILTILFLIGVISGAWAADAAPPAQLFRAGEVQLDAIGQARTEDLDHWNAGGGIGLNYFPWRAAGAGIEATTYDTRHAFFDKLGLNLVGRLPVDQLRLAPEFRIGFNWTAEQVQKRCGDDFEVYASIGAELRIAEHFGIGAEVRGVRPIEDARGEHVLGLIRARFIF